MADRRGRLEEMMNNKRYEKTKILMEKSPYAGERAAAMEALKRMDATQAKRVSWQIVWTLDMQCMRPEGMPKFTTC